MGARKLAKEKVTLEDRVARPLRQYGRGLLGLLVAVMIVHDIFGAHGFLAMRRTQDEIKKVQANLDKLNKDNLELRQEVKDLKTDPQLIEKIARDDLGLARPGEVIIRIPQAPAQEPGTPAKH